MAIVRYRPEVADDLRDAALWYDERQAGLGDEFLAEFRAAISAIAERPLSFAIASTGLRACRFARFPYIVHFRCEADAILVVAVMFGGRDSSGWMDRA